LSVKQYRPCADHVQTMCRPCADHVQTMCRPCADPVQTLCRPRQHRHRSTESQTGRFGRPGTAQHIGPSIAPVPRRWYQRAMPAQIQRAGSKFPKFRSLASPEESQLGQRPSIASRLGETLDQPAKPKPKRAEPSRAEPTEPSRADRAELSRAWPGLHW